MAQFRDENATAFKITPETKFTKLGERQMVVGRHRLKYLTSKRRDDDYEKFNPEEKTKTGI